MAKFSIWNRKQNNLLKGKKRAEERLPREKLGKPIKVVVEKKGDCSAHTELRFCWVKTMERSGWQGS